MTKSIARHAACDVTLSSSSTSSSGTRMGFDPKEIGSSAQVYTSQGTVLFVDGASGELRHGSPETSPFNVALALDGEHVRICFYDGTSERTIACQPDCSARVDSGTVQANEETAGIASSLFTRLPTGGREFGLAAQGKFLCAEPAGQITLSRSECSDWGEIPHSNQCISAERYHNQLPNRRSSRAFFHYREARLDPIAPMSRRFLRA